MTFKKFSLAVFVGLFSLALAACGQSTEGHGDHSTSDGSSDHDMSDHSAHKMDEGGDDMAVVQGAIVQVFADAGRVKIDHEAIPSINMAAMTMSFQTVSDVDLARFAEGDEVHFTLKRGRDGSYRIMQMCKTDGSDQECMSHMKH